MKLKSILILWLISLQFNAQNNYLTARLGITSMYLTESVGSISANSESKIGFSSALGFELNISKYLSFQPELNFTNKGYKVNQNSQSLDMKLNYLDVPIMLRGKFPIEDILEIYIEAGPSFSIGMGGSAIINGTEYTDVFGTSGFNRIDYGLNLGTGFNINIAEKYKVGLGYRLYKGFGELYPTNPSNISGKNNGYMIGLNFSSKI